MISDHADPLNRIGSKESGGQNVYVYFLAHFLAKNGVYVDVYTRRDRPNKSSVVRVNKYIRVIRVKAGPKHYMPRDNFFNVVDEFAESVLRRVNSEKIKYDLIHTNYVFSGIIGLKLKAKLRLPLVHVYHSIGIVRFEALQKLKKQATDYVFFKTRNMAEAEIAKKSTAIISTSPIEKNLIKKYFNITVDKIKFIPIGVDTNIFRPIKTTAARSRLKMPPKKKILLYVGRLEWRKGVGTLLYAFKEVLKKYPGSLLYIRAGGVSKTAELLEHAERVRLEQIALELGIAHNIKYVKPKSKKVLSYYYNAADVTVTPSYYEPFGIVPIESMACGTPVVGSRTGGIRYTVVDGVTGYLAEPRNPIDLAKKIISALKKGKKSCAVSCIERVHEHFLWDKIVKQYIKYFEELIQK